MFQPGPSRMGKAWRGIVSFIPFLILHVNCCTCESPFPPEVCATGSGHLSSTPGGSSTLLSGFISVSYLPIFWAPSLAITFRNIPVYGSPHPDKEMLLSLTPVTTVSPSLRTNDGTASCTSCQCPLARDLQGHPCSWTSCVCCSTVTETSRWGPLGSSV